MKGDKVQAKKIEKVNPTYPRKEIWQCQIREVLLKHKSENKDDYLAGNFSNTVRSFLTKQFNKLRNKLGLSTDLKLYGLKHTGVQRLYEQTKDTQLIKNMCRHSNLAITDAYLAREGWG